MSLQSRLVSRIASFTALAALAAAAAVAGPALGSGPDLSGLRMSTPFTPLFTQVASCQQVLTDNNLSDPALSSTLSQLTSWYVHFHADTANTFNLGHSCQGKSPTTLASKLAARGAMVSNYRNGSYTSQAGPGDPDFGEAGLMEQHDPLAISTFWPGQYARNQLPSSAATLSLPLTGTATTVSVSASVRPVGAPATWPYVNSRGTGLAAGAYSTDTYNFVSWIRVDDEIMQVAAAPVANGATVSLTVRRGIFGTVPTAHAAGARVMSPVYVGSNNVNNSTTNYNGAPLRADAQMPLRYGLKIWLPQAQQFIADRVNATFGGGDGTLAGYNSVWLDVSSCGFFDQAAADATPVTPYDDVHAGMFTTDNYGQAEQAKFAGIRQRLPGINVLANNLITVGAAGPCNSSLMAGGLDGGVLENWMDYDASTGYIGGNWNSVLNQSIAIQQHNWPALYWVRWDITTEDSALYRRFAYASLLLSYEPTATAYQFGGPWSLSAPDPLLFWNWGTPIGSPRGASDLLAPNGLYQRAYTNGLILVNPGSTAITDNLGQTMYDAVHLDGSGNPSPVTSVTVPAHDAALLLRGSPLAEPAPSAAVTSPAAGATVTAGPLAVSGNASAASGVATVRVAVQDTSTGLWLQPNGSEGNYVSLPASLVNPGANSTNWSIGWSLPAGQYAVAATATGADGSVGGSVPNPLTATPDTAAPTTTLSVSPAAPAHGSVVTLSGTASDNAAVASGTVSVRCAANGTYLQSSGRWATTYAALSLPLASPGSASSAWSLTFTPPVAGSYSVAVIVKDSSRNASKATTKFTAS